MAVAIFDGHYLAHRVMHVPHLRVLSTKHGKPSGGMFGFIKSLRATVGAWPEIRRVVVVFDGGRSKRRQALFKGYKNRKHEEIVDPDGLSYKQKFRMMLSYLNFVLPKLGIKVVRLASREGDDVVGFLARNLDDTLKLVVSDDKDMYQLVDEDVHVWRPLKEERVSLSNFEDVAGCTKKNFLLRKACLGDASDTIPGIKGVGEKTVDKVFEAVEDIGPYPYDEFFSTALMMKGKKIQSIAENMDVVLRNYELVDISKEELTEDEIRWMLAAVEAPSKLDVLAVKSVFVNFEFFSLIEDFNKWIVPFQLLR